MWVKDIDLFANPNIIVGMSLPYLDDELSLKIEPHAPSPTLRYKALLKGRAAGCRLYVAVAPTPPNMTKKSALCKPPVLLSVLILYYSH